MIGRRVGTALLAIAGFAGVTQAQDRGAGALGPLVAGLGTSVRVLLIGAHPDDEDTPLIAYLSRGRQVRTAYLSLTRGEGGQNLIGTETGEGLGVLRTAEVLAARSVDGAQQYFTRAYDFGASKSADETFEHWGRIEGQDQVIADVVTIVRAFRPQIIVSMYAGDARDGHGQHQVAGLVAREAATAAADTDRFPRERYGRPWLPLKLYRVVHADEAGADTAATLRVNVGEYAPLLGRTFVELAAESRARQRSQGVASPASLGTTWDLLQRVATRVGPDDARRERSLFDGIDTTFARLRRPDQPAAFRDALDSLGGAVARVQAAYRPDAPAEAVAPLAALATLAAHVASLAGATSRGAIYDADAARSLEDLWHRAQDALVLASGVVAYASAERETVARATGADSSDTLRVGLTVFNRGRGTVQVDAATMTGGSNVVILARAALQPDSAWRGTLTATPRYTTEPWWKTQPRLGDLYMSDVDGRTEDEHQAGNEAGALRVLVRLRVAGSDVALVVPVLYRPTEPGRLAERPVAVVPGITVRLDHAYEYARAGTRLARPMRVTVQSSYAGPRTFDLTLKLPPGLTTDSATRRVTLPAGATAVAVYTVRGLPDVSAYQLDAEVALGADRYSAGLATLVYEHVPPLRIRFPARTYINAIALTIPAGAFVGYVAGTPDQTTRMLTELGVPVTQLDANALALPGADLSRYTAIVIGPRAYETAPALYAANPRLFAFARGGGTVLVQYGRYEMEQPGVLPFPIALGRPARMATEEEAPVRLLGGAAGILARPNRIVPRDFERWLQDRALYLPESFDAHWQPALEVGDAGEPPSRGALLVAPMGRGAYVYTTLSLFRQLPAAHAGAARLFVNLLAPRAPTSTIAR